MAKRSPKLKWARSKGNKRSCKRNKGCKQTLCINDNGHAKTFKYVYQATNYLRQKKLKKTNVIAVARGKCTDVYNDCIYTEWFDLDDPLIKGDYERITAAHDYVVSSDPHYTKEKRRHYSLHRTCEPDQIKGDAEFQTTKGEPVEEGDDEQSLSIDGTSIECVNKYNKKKLSVSYQWGTLPKEARLDKVTCKDYKLRYCCQDLWGRPSRPGKDKKSKYHKKLKYDVMVHPPEKDDLFVGCEWRNYLSAT